MKTLMSIILLCCSFAASGQNLAREIENTIQGKRASVGVAVIYEDEILTVSNDNKYPLMSVFKLHVALTALCKMEVDGTKLDKMTVIKPEQMHANTYSPLRDRHPNQRIRISYRDIITYTLMYSDNNTCDWLIDYVEGLDNVNAYIKSIGINDFNLSQTESDMHLDILNSYLNWSTPLSVAQLLKKIYIEGILNEEHFAFIEETMINCASGKDKLKAGLPDNIALAHKTGHSDRTADGKLICDADAGVIYLSDNKKCYIVVLIQDSYESDQENSKLFSDICKITYEHYK